MQALRRFLLASCHLDNGDAFAALRRSSKFETLDQGMLGQHVTHCLAHLARPLAVHDPQPRYTSAKAVVQELLDLRQRLVQRLTAYLDLLSSDRRKRHIAALGQALRRPFDADDLTHTHARPEPAEAHIDFAA